MEQKELDEILRKHKLWLEGSPEGVRANLQKYNLQKCNLKDADLDYSCIPLWGGGLDIHFDDRQIIQQLYHLVRNALYSENVSDDIKVTLSTDELIDLANKFHRVDECGKITKES